jgi:hypothetical protein
MTERDDHDVILSLLAEGYSISKAAHVLGLDEADIRAALKAASDSFRNGEYLRQTWALEDWRLGKLGAKFFKDAMNSEGSAAYQSAVAFCRLSSRRAELAGANAPLSYSVTLMQQAAPPQLTSTQRIQLAVDHTYGMDTTPQDILEEWEGRRPELEEKRKAIERLRNERKQEPKADEPAR